MKTICIYSHCNILTWCIQWWFSSIQPINPKSVKKKQELYYFVKCYVIYKDNVGLFSCNNNPNLCSDKRRKPRRKTTLRWNSLRIQQAGINTFVCLFNFFLIFKILSGYNKLLLTLFISFWFVQSWISLGIQQVDINLQKSSINEVSKIIWFECKSNIEIKFTKEF